MGLYSKIDNTTFSFLRGVKNFFVSVKDALKAFASIIMASIARFIAYSLVFLLPCFILLGIFGVSEDSSVPLLSIVSVVNVIVAFTRSVLSRRTDPDMGDIVEEIAEIIEDGIE